MPHSVASQRASPLPGISRSNSLNSRGRKMSSTGGHRSWSDEEESYLLQTRAQKMPYKHIAAHLNKTELACRLHYHQLSHGSHRRKRTASVSSAMSHGSTPSSGSSPRSYFQYGYGNDGDYTFSSSPVRYGSAASTPSQPSQKVLLPKPATMTPLDHHVLRTSTALPSTGPVDPDRLRSIYDQHRTNFWSTIAQDYGTNISPGHLEALWQTQGRPMQRPPTPGDSPDRMRSSLGPSAMPLYSPYTGASYSSSYSTASSFDQPSYTASSIVSTPDRIGYYTPQTSTSQYGHAGLTRHHTWGNQTNAGAPTAISSLLTENRCPRGAACTGANCGHGHY